MSETLCAAFSKVSIDTWHRIQEGHTLSYLFGEETLTDMLIRDLLRHRLPGFQMEAFNKYEEGKNGADWEWWFRGKSGKWLGLRVQAKVIDETGTKFKHLHHSYVSRLKSASMALKDVYQCDRLIDRALNEEPARPRVPIYCLYSYWTNLPHSITSGTLGWPLRLYDGSFGCSVMAAENVMRLRVSTATGRLLHKCALSDTLPYSSPLLHLVCNPFVVAGDSIVEKMLQMLRAIGATEGNSEQYLLESPPDYVTQLLQLRRIKRKGDKEQVSLDLDINLPEGLGGVLAISQEG